MVILKTQREIEKMKDSGYIVADVLYELKQNIRPNITTKYLNDKAEKIIRQHKAIPGFLNYKGFPFTICASINEEVVHGLPSNRKLIDGDIISIDVGVNYNGWFGDACFTTTVGEVSPQTKRLVRVTKECLKAGITQAQIENNLEDISYAIQSHAEDNGFNVIRDYVGHGIGKNLHESPQVKNYGEKGNGLLLKSGMVIAIEPIVAEGDFKTEKLGNNWTVVTKDRKLVAHFEHTVAITSKGPIILTSNKKFTNVLDK
jgi:methionyl aminopeptidase